MADLVSLQVQVDTRPVDKATQAFRRFGAGANKSSKAVKAYRDRVRQASRETKGFNATVNKLRSGLMLLSTGIAGIGVVNLAQQIERATTQMNNINATMTVAAGSASAAGRQLAFIRKESERLGLFFPTMAKQMAQFAAAARSSSITGAELEEIFTGIAEASRAMGLTAPQAEGAMLALQQMMSKGKVSAEELRQQLGERMPGSIQIMANAIGVTTQKLFEMMENGELLAEEVLPKFGREMSRVFGAAAEVQANKIAAAIQRLRNSFFDLMAQDTLTGATDAINELSEVVSSDMFQNNFDNFVQMLSKLGTFIARNLELIVALSASLAGIAVTKITRMFAGLAKSLGVLASRSRAAIPLLGGLALALNRVKFSLLTLAGPIGAIAGAAAGLFVFKGASEETRLEASFLELSLDEINDRMQNIKNSADEAGLATLQMMQKSAQPGFEQFIADSKEIAAIQRDIAELAPQVSEEMEKTGRSITNVPGGKELNRLRAQLRSLISVRDQFAEDAEAFTVIQKAIDATTEKMSRLNDEAINTQEEFDALTNQARDLMEELFPERRALREYLEGLQLIEKSLAEEIMTAREAAMARRALNKEFQTRTSPDFGTGDEADNLNDISKNLNQIIGKYDPMVAAAIEYKEEIVAVNQALDKGLISQAKASELIVKIEEDFDRATHSATGMQKVLEDVGSVIKDDISNGLTDIIMQAESAKDVFQSLLDTIARTLIQQQVVDPFVSSIGASLPSFFGAGSGSAAAGASASQLQSMSFLPQNANGGNVYGGSPSIVGERGPELFIPRQDGSIVPNHRMGGGGDVTVNIINEGGERLETQGQQHRRGPNGEMTVDVMVKSSMERLDAQGQLDGIFRRHGARRQGQF